MVRNRSSRPKVFWKFFKILICTQGKTLDVDLECSFLVKFLINWYVQLCLKLTPSKILFKKNFMAPFYGWGSTASMQQPLRRGSLLFTTKFPEIPGTQFIDLGRMKRLNQPWSHPVVLNMKSLDWESSVLNTRPFIKEYAWTLRGTIFLIIS